jgi:hypothetical protein
MARKTTLTPLRAALLVSPTTQSDTVRMELSDAAMLRVRSAPDLRTALEVVDATQPHVIVMEHGALAEPALNQLRHAAEARTSRRIPFIVYGTPIPAPRYPKEVKVLAGEYRLATVVQAVKDGLAAADREREAATNTANQPSG